MTDFMLSVEPAKGFDRGLLVRADGGLSFCLVSTGPGPFLSARSGCCGGRHVYRGALLVCHKCFNPVRPLPVEDADISAISYEQVEAWVKAVLPAFIDPLRATLVAPVLTERLWEAKLWLFSTSVLEEPEDDLAAVPLSELYADQAKKLSGSVFR